MTTEPSNLSADDARQALQSVNEMERAGWRRSVPPRWVCTGYAFFAGGTCATFSLEPLKYSYFFWWLIAYIVFKSFAVIRRGAYERDHHPPKERRAKYWGSTLGMLIVGLGSIYLRYAFELPWFAIAGGLTNGIWIYLYYEIERRDALKTDSPDTAR